MLIDILREYYGIPDIQTSQFIAEKTKGMAEEKQNEIAERVKQKHSQRYGFPDIAVLSKYFDTVQVTTKKYYWSVCNDCKAQFDYRFNTCPKCFLVGKKSSGYGVKVSDYQPPKSVIRWNQTSLNIQEKEHTCYDCDHKDEGFCKYFGRPDWQCNKTDYEYCPCKKCCAEHRRANEKAGIK